MRLLLAVLSLLCVPFADARSPEDLVKAARAQIGVTTGYDPAYRKLAFPGGDVAPDRGVCTDVVIPPIASSASTCRHWSTATCAPHGRRIRSTGA